MALHHRSPRQAFFRDAFIHGIKIRPEKTSVEVVTEVLPGKSGNNRWSALINTTGFWPGENMVTAYSNKNWAINSTKKVLLISTDYAAPTIDDE
ncbi:MAG: hypothetical protein KAW93_03495 [Methanogenium sp.]|nr:hypothetical protein [Methanogenium sp.]